MLFGISQEVLKGIPGSVSTDSDGGRDSHSTAHKLEVVGRQVSEAQGAKHGGLNGHIGHGIAVGIGVADLLQADGARSSLNIGDDDAGVKGLLELRGVNTGHGVRGAASSVGNDQRDLLSVGEIDLFLLAGVSRIGSAAGIAALRGLAAVVTTGGQ